VQDQASSFRNLLPFLTFVRPYRWRLALSTTVGIVKDNLPVAFPWILKDVIDRSLAGKQSATGLSFDQLMLVSAMLFLLLAVITYFRTSLAGRLTQDMTFDIRSALFQHLQRLPVDFFQKYRTGTISSRLITDANMAQSLVGLAGTNLFMDLTRLGSITAIIVYMNWKLALVTYCTLPLYLMLHRLVSRQMRGAAKEARQRMDLIESDLHETVSGILEVKSFTFENEETNKFFARYRHYLQSVYKNIRTHGVSLAITTVLTRLPAVLVIWTGGRMVLSQNLTVGSLMAFYAYMEMIYSPLRHLSELNIDLANARAAIDRLFEFFATKPETGSDSAPALMIRKGEISFQNLVFGYCLGHPVFKGIHLQIPAGRSIALVGESGAGKSTLMRLLFRFHQPWEGKICIDGQDVCTVNLPSLRSQIAVVHQDLTLFSGSVEDNIRVGKPNAGRKEIIEAAGSANAMAFIEDLPEGLQTEIGERGVKLSGGQRQRIAIARAFLKNAPILVLDESTSDLDTISEKLIHEALRQLIERRTTIIVAHRISTVMLADRVVVLHRGEIVQEGSHDDLLRRTDGQYYRLYGPGAPHIQP
jgi:ATP-binding cassette, subfamily B, putative efflux pump